ncbi:CHASE2 domain-containing protein [Microbaculum marinisediminis]|uniref:Adenylate/guanylate cyclase domain-containing protein n=1 Tax=Microbaculum marinisediminis TaxID=2931392 RepID=A0AAW5QWF0_9HYPH|nr:adenylate/guanylate cyclase domain-containing protein [Microbaculum sp. A6E488]MCT8972386.1 adenylate/guanylate cyclase domain-containing protein [Microbaculum sp. A6E488]
MGTRATYALAIAVIILSVAGIRLLDPDPLVRLRLLAFDVFQRLAPRPVDPAFPVRIVDIDQASLSAYGRWPWPRELVARLVVRLEQLGAVVIAFDFAFPDPEPDPLAALYTALEDRPEARTLLDQLPKPRSGDDAFAAAIGEGSVVLGAIGRADAGPEIPPAPTSFALLGSDPSRHVPTFRTATLNTPVLNDAAAGIGSLNWFPESDQIVRKVPLVVRFGDALYPSLVSETLRLAEGADTIAIRSSTAGGEGSSVESGITSVRIGNHRIPTEESGQMWLAFSPHRTERYISAASVLDGTVKPEDIAGRIVVIGTSAPGLFDLRATPLDAVLPGVEVHAQALEQLLQGRLMLRPDYSTGLEIAYTAVGSIALAAMIYYLGAFTGALAGALAVIIVLTVSWVGYLRFGILLDPMMPWVVLTVVYGFATVFFYFQTERERNRVRQAFSHYIAPSLVERLAEHPEQLTLGGETRELTVLFSDVRGFTGIAEGYRDNPPALIALMNRLLTPLTNAITERSGTIDKYIGDAIMAFWNAPLDDPHHSRRACEASLEMIDRLRTLNAARRSEAAEQGADGAVAELRLGIGIATGVAIVGNMGSDMRFDYSALGDAVNLASRLENLTAYYGVTTLVSDAACQRGAADMTVLEIDTVRVKGREHPERIWTILGGSELQVDSSLRSVMEQFSAALAAYRRQDWAGAQQQFASLSRAAAPYGLSDLADLFAERCVYFARTPPPADWDGVWQAQKM